MLAQSFNENDSVNVNRSSLNALLRLAARVAPVIFSVLPVWVAAATPLQTPLEAAQYHRLSSTAEVARFLKALEHRNSGRARHIVLGRSAGKRSLDALLVSDAIAALASAAPPTRRLRVMIAGSQHGTETSGGEALLMLSRNLLEGAERSLLQDLEFILLPLANPDGRDTNRRKNANEINLSTDFSALTQPESRALLDALVRWRPDVFVDLHESGVFKATTLARQGYMTDFETQVEIANNPNVDRAVAAFSREQLRPATLARLQEKGLRATNYIGEIIDVNQRIRHGGLTLRNIRNRAAMEGAFSLLIESRLDPPHGIYPTPGNIRVRTAKQLLAIQELLATCRAERKALAARSRAARKMLDEAGGDDRVSLVARYAPLPEKEKISIELRRIDNAQLEMHSFPYIGRIVASDDLALPAAYAVTASQDRIGQVLKRQHIRQRILREPRQCRATVQHVVTRELDDAPRGLASWHSTIKEREQLILLQPGTLWVDLHQPRRRVASLLLEPGSNSSLFEHRDFAPLVKAGEDFFILRINGDCRVRGAW